MVIDYNKIKKYISKQRLQKYMDVSAGDMRMALKLYQTNLRISQAFYPLLSLFEVILRNALNDELSKYYNDPDWIISQRTGFMVDYRLKYYDKKKSKYSWNRIFIKEVDSSLKRLGGAANGADVLASMKLGFWTAFFQKTHYVILAGRPIKIFPMLPMGTSRWAVYGKLLKIKEFRNRIYHNEPIIFKKELTGTTFSTQLPENIHSEITLMFSWLDLDFEKWTKKINGVDFEIRRAKCVLKYYPTIFYYLMRMVIGCRFYANKYTPIGHLR